MSGGGFRVSIPNSVRKTIQNIKEITGNHSDEEIYAMLKECSMDPNETTQKLLNQDTFHVVKRKRERRKENTGNKEPAEPRWRSNMQGRGGRGGRVNYAPRYVSHDAGGGRNSATGKESMTNQVSEKEVAISPLLTTQESKNKETTPLAGTVTIMADGATAVASGSTSATHASHLPGGIGGNQSERSSTDVDVNKLGSAPPVPPSVNVNKTPTIAFGTGDTQGQPNSSSVDHLASKAAATSSAVCFSSSDPVLVPSHDSWFSGAVGTIKREVGSQRAPDAIVPAENKSTAATSESESSFMQGKVASKSQTGGKSQLTETSQHSPLATQGVSAVSRPSSNYNIRSQQVIGPQKVGPSKEWKPKPTNSNLAQGSATSGASEVPNISVEAGAAQSQPALGVLDSEETTSNVQRKLGELHIHDHQHVIIPIHIHVPESERSGLSFGSIDASFGVSTSYISGPESDKSSTVLSETSPGIEETVEEQPSSNQNVFATGDEGDYSEHQQSPTQIPENLSSVEGDVSTVAAPEYTESKQEAALPHGGQQYSMHNSPNYGFGFMPPMLGSQLAQYENTDSQARDASRLPSFLVQQPFDPASYYAQFYRSGADSDGRISPFPSPGVAAKYNGNVAVLSPQTSQSPQEGGNSLVQSTAGPTPLVSQAGGVMQNSIAVTQQPVPVFRPPAGMHISHYPPNYIPYGHYFSPFYVPPPAIHQFLSNGAFPQQPQAGSVYAAGPPSAAGMGVKYSLSQFKPGTNTGNSAPIGMPSGYGPYGSSPAGYNPSSAATAGNSTTNEDLAASQYKDSNVYIPGQQSEGSAVWIAAPGRDISSLPTSSFYNLPPQGQHVTFAPSQAGQGTFTGIYHHGQAVTAATVHPLLQQSQTMTGAVDMVGPTANVYQQPQHAQINWPSNY